MNLKEILEKQGIEVTPEEVLEEQEAREAKHRAKTVVERPKEEFHLRAVFEEEFIPKKKQSDPTPSLVRINWEIGTEDWKNEVGANGYIIYCSDTNEVWFAPDKECLDANFIYRKDLEISEFTGTQIAIDRIQEYIGEFRPGIVTRKTCYILDMPGSESYEVYYDSNYPSLKYGLATPRGSFIHKYSSRFSRDMAIMELDDLYSGASKKDAGKMTKKELKSNQAIVISDGAWIKETSTSSVWYLDVVSSIRFTDGAIPSEPDQAVLISEIRGATNALQLCYMKKKTDITYYYDNTSILNVFRNRKTEYITEIVEYKKLLETMASEGYNIKFVELHPKTGEDRENDNKALMFFHNECDASCTFMADIFKKDYKSFAVSDDKQGKTYSQVKTEFAPKGKPRTGGNGYHKPGQVNNGNNKYGRRF